MDAFDVVREMYRAFNRADAPAVAAFYHPDCLVEDGWPGVGAAGAVCRGREAVAADVRQIMDARSPGFDDRTYFRVRTIGGIGTGWGWVQADWHASWRDRASAGDELRWRGYTHFLVDDGLIRRQRSVWRIVEPDEEPAREETGGRHYPTRPVVGVGAVIVTAAHDNRAISAPAGAPSPGVVLIKRKFEPLAGQWSLPGGTLEVGETLEAGVAREMVEETGLAVEVGPVVDVFDRILFDQDQRVRYHFVLIDYLCRVVGGRLQHASDVSDVTIADPEALESYGLTEKAQAVIRRAVSMARAR